MRWFDAQGGHLETKGIFLDGNGKPTVKTVPLHRHHVTLNIYRVDLGLKYYFGPRFVLELNIPYEVKAQEATIEKIEAVTDEQWQAILRNRHNHHRSETYTGPTDLDVLIGHHLHGIFRKSDFLLGRIGTTIPTGKTEEDPWKLGDAGLKHLHIQFGTGTFNPIADLHYSLPLYNGLGANMSIRTKLPFYQNSKTYRGSREITYTAGLNYRLNKWFLFQASYLGFYQHYAYWDGELDFNTGLRYSMASLGTVIATPYSLPIAITVMLPLQQEMLYDNTDAFLEGRYEERDAFEFGPLISLTAMYSF